MLRKKKKPKKKMADKSGEAQGAAAGSADVVTAAARLFARMNVDTLCVVDVTINHTHH